MVSPGRPTEWTGLSSPPKRSMLTLQPREEGTEASLNPPFMVTTWDQSWLRDPAMEKESRPPRAGRGGSRHVQDLRVSIGNSNPGHGACVTAQEEEGDVTSCGHQVDEHSHPNGPEGRKTELLHQETAQEDAQAGTRDCRHPWERHRGAGTVSRGGRASPRRQMAVRPGGRALHRPNSQ